MQRLPGLRVKGCFSLSWCECSAGGTALRIEGGAFKEAATDREAIIKFWCSKIKKRKTTKKKTASIICVLDGEQYKEISRPRAIKSLPPTPWKLLSNTLREIFRSSTRILETLKQKSILNVHIEMHRAAYYVDLHLRSSDGRIVCFSIIILIKQFAC